MQIPQLINIITKELVTSREVSTIFLLVLGIIIVTAISGIGDYIFHYAAKLVGTNTAAAIRRDFLSSMQKHSFSFYDRNNSGQIIARGTGDIEAVRIFLAWGMGELIFGVFLMVNIVYRFVFISQYLLSIITIMIPFIVVIGFIFARKQRPLSLERRNKFGEIAEAIRENIVGMKVVRSFHREKYQQEKFALPNREFLEINVSRSRNRAIFVPMMTLAVGIITGVTFLFGGGLVMEGKIAINELMEAYALLILLVIPTRMLGALVSMGLEALAGFTRIFAMMNSGIEIKDVRNALTMDDIQGEIKLENVSFSYNSGRPTLSNVTLTIRSGEVVAIVGAAGSGKSTLINLIPRFYDVSKGRITIDGVDIKKIKLQSLRSNIGIVHQDTFLFSSTIKENIALNTPGVTIDNVIRVAKIAKLHQFISSLPNKYETAVGERGVTLSGGQKQRLAIARALLVDPKILILDDATSSIDVDTEYEIQEELKSILKDRTTLIITQRLSAIRLVDRIIVLSDGKIIETGTHDELLANNGKYSQIYRAHFRSEDAPI